MSEEEMVDTNESTVEPEIETVVEEPTEEVKPKAKAKPSKGVPSPRAVVGDGETDVVYLSRCEYMSKVTHKSLSVHHLQRRLAELGYQSAASDPDGWYKDETKAAVAAFQKDNGLDGDGLITAETLEAVFDGDGNVTIALS